MIKYYAGANSSGGYVSFLKENISHHDKIFYVINTTKQTRNEILKALEDVCCELILKPGNHDDFDAIITDKCVITFVCENGIDTKEIDFLKPLKDEMFMHLKKAKEIHDEWEKIYISAMDFKKAQSAADETSKKLITGKSSKGNGKNITRFLGTMTESVSINFIDNLTDGFKKRVFIKGRPGTGKSTLLKKVRQYALAKGFDTETYLCSFDANSLDMVIIRELGVCIFDSTAPHEMFPSRDTDEILDIYEIALAPETDEKNLDLLKEISLEYGREISKAKECMKKINSDSIEQCNNLVNEIINLIK